MREFVDKERGLTWVVPEVKEMSVFGQPIYFDKDTKDVKGFSKELNEYQSDSIDEYITGGEVPLGDFVEWSIMGDELPYYAFDDGKLVATVVVDGKSEICACGLEDYIKYRSEKCNPKLNNSRDYLPLAKAKKIFKKSTSDNNIHLGYLVVVPTAQGRGVGTRVVSSIMHNPQFFATNSSPVSLDASVHKNNMPSQKVFKRNGFKDYTLRLAKDFSSFHDYINEI